MAKIASANNYRFYQIFFMWTFLVIINAALSFVYAAGLLKNAEAWAAILGAIFTFIVIYSLIDFALLRQGHYSWHRSLVISAIVKALLQVFNMIELYTGLFAMMIVMGNKGGDPKSFWDIYAVTMVDGVLLSLFVLAFTAAIRTYFKYRQKSTALA